ncbi:MAG: prepilin-type N-terminal cleavage/methylation domain-containing protein [Deltaproteobacteria bacterium]|nr:prepilin-type N-terminal cleavage/methylation domain-containing protein [Deltaproteobacteria bacterium]
MIVRRRLAVAGFTLIEVMVAVALFATVITLVWGSFSLGATGKRQGEAIADRYYQVRVGVGRLVRDISMSFISKNDTPGAITPRTFFVGQRNSRHDELKFSYLGHARLREDARESDQATVRYFVRSDPENRRLYQLVRQETNRLGGEQPIEESGHGFVLVDDVLEFHLRYFDEQKNEWTEQWNTTSVDGQPDRLPTKIEVQLTINDERDKPLRLVTATRTFLRDPLWFSAQ